MRSALGVLLAALAIALAGCATPGEMGSPANRRADLATLKEVNRHIEQCRRVYGWPFTATITCEPVVQPTADEIRKMVEDAVKRQLQALIETAQKQAAPPATK